MWSDRVKDRRWKCSEHDFSSFHAQDLIVAAVWFMSSSLTYEDLAGYCLVLKDDVHQLLGPTRY